MKIYVDSKDNIGWSIDSDRMGVLSSLKRLGIPHTSFWGKADIVHNIWWNNILRPRKFLLRFKKNILVTTSNFIDPDMKEFSLQKEFKKVKKIAKGWISPSTKQKKILESYGLRTYYQPFYLDLDLFSPSQMDLRREELLNKFSIPPEKVKDRLIIGSFQRDSLGSDLTKAKWQKGPDILVQILRDMPRDKFVLLLAGPRRHYLIKECRKHNIPYYFIGRETQEDDLYENKLDIKHMPLLYALTDIYLVTSKSEGGPKSVMEATATKTFILSTDVGLAFDFLPSEHVYSLLEDFKKQVFDLIKYPHRFEQIQQTTVERNYANCMGILDYDQMDKRLLNIYTDILQ